MVGTAPVLWKVKRKHSDLAISGRAAKLVSDMSPSALYRKALSMG